MASVPDPTDSDGGRWGAYPSVTMGAGQWRIVLAALRRTGTKRDAALADRITRYLENR